MESDLRRLADGLLKQLESDRARVAGVLADEVASVLTIARYLIEHAMHRLARGEADETLQALKNATERIRDASQRLATVCSELWPRLLDDLGLLAALSSHFRDFSRDNRSISISARITIAERDVPAELKLPVFRVVQEALTNVARHSKATVARVCLSRFEDELRLLIEDDGVGFDAERLLRRPQPADSRGLDMISHWVESSGGHCTIEAAPRHGARVKALWRIPPAGLAASRAQDKAKPGTLSAAANA